MKRHFLVLALAIVVAFLALPFSAQSQSTAPAEKVIKLTQPKYDGSLSVEKALLERRSVRSYKDEPLNMAEISQILWAAQGITEPKRGLRTAPSARALYLLNTYLLVGNVTGLPVGMYRYQPQGHELVRIAEKDTKAELYKAVGQATIKNAPAVLVFTGLTDRSTNSRWMYLEAGHAAQNVFLQAQSLKLGTVTVGGFKDADVAMVLNLPNKEEPIYIMPLGRK
jgi:SagB-type dehydrogenase family enzyme